MRVIQMLKNIMLVLAGVLFGIVSVLHLLRIIYSISIIIDGYTLPMWVSWVGFFVTLLLSISMFVARSHDEH